MEEVKCPFCEKNVKKEKLKDNTHYLTDGIIKSALNFDSSNERGRGVIFEGDDQGHIKVKFQQHATEAFEKVVGREATNPEIEEAKSTPDFSVAKIFCEDCETKFEKIETKFQDDISKRLRTQKPIVTSKNSNLIRVFFLLQVWRSSIVDRERDFKLPIKVEKELRDIIYEYAEILLKEENLKKLTKDRTKRPQERNEQEIEKKQEIFEQNNRISKKHPLIIYYLETNNGEYNNNHVACLTEQNPFIILMNDFIIQFYESKGTLEYIDLYGLNKEQDFDEEVNYEEQDFKIILKSNLIREIFLKEVAKESSCNQKIDVEKQFKTKWYARFEKNPEQQVVEMYIKALINSADYIYGNSDIKMIDFSKENIDIQTNKFIDNYISNDKLLS